jgi:uncharacterized CHY-type Zn-finger protein
MALNTKKYEFTNSDGLTPRKFLVCPQCREYITQVDIENFSSCPFCNVRLNRNNELEDFVLQPLAERWAEQYSSSLSVRMR